MEAFWSNTDINKTLSTKSFYTLDEEFLRYRGKIGIFPRYRFVFSPLQMLFIVIKIIYLALYLNLINCNINIKRYLNFH